jgi:hypothetical protein
MSNFSELFQLKKTISANGVASYTKIPSRSRVAGFWFTRSQTAKPYIVQSTAQKPLDQSAVVVLQLTENASTPPARLPTFSESG